MPQRVVGPAVAQVLVSGASTMSYPTLKRPSAMAAAELCRNRSETASRAVRVVESAYGRKFNEILGWLILI